MRENRYDNDGCKPAPHNTHKDPGVAEAFSAGSASRVERRGLCKACLFLEIGFGSLAGPSTPQRTEFGAGVNILKLQAQANESSGMKMLPGIKLAELIYG